MKSAPVKMNAAESALLLVSMARDNIKGCNELGLQLADIRLRRAEEALRGSVQMEEYERKLVGAD